MAEKLHNLPRKYWMGIVRERVIYIFLNIGKYMHSANYDVLQLISRQNKIRNNI